MWYNTMEWKNDNNEVASINKIKLTIISRRSSSTLERGEAFGFSGSDWVFFSDCAIQVPSLTNLSQVGCIT